MDSCSLELIVSLALFCIQYRAIEIIIVASLLVCASIMKYALNMHAEVLALAQGKSTFINKLKIIYKISFAIATAKCFYTFENMLISFTNKQRGQCIIKFGTIIPV